MKLSFNPFRLPGLLFFLGGSFAWLGWLQGRELPFFTVPAMEFGAEGSVLHYASMVLSRSLSTAYPALMLFVFLILLIYACLQMLGLVMDMRHQRKRAGSIPARDLPIRWAGPIASALGRPLSRFTEVSRWQDSNWRNYCGQAPGILLSPITLAVQIFPLFGFIGTIAGIASALKYLPVGDNTDASIDNLTASLYTAFDTTFIGLIASLSLMLLGYAMERGWAGIQQHIADDVRDTDHGPDSGRRTDIIDGP
uniref:MotA/TolQ/ExbB proton channel family protein n=1 Tax=Candidatus Kentrum sp. DK TaxID=2126562 RepID=A0A450RVQ4_9GAMM|nr:MAG: MotA/TolQ/ExbB proton channel family protein [Candidatus Kentron sp. DK]